MKKFFPYLMLITGLFAVSCGSGYQVASSRYDDATYFRPDVTARVHMLATAQEAEALINETIINAEKEGVKVETVYTDPQGVANIDVEPGTTYLVMNSQDDSYERKLEMFSDDPDDSFSLTINMSFDYGDWWGYPFYDNYWYGGWNRHRYWYMPMSYWDSWYWYPRTWYSDFWYNDYFYNYWYYPSWYHMWSYSGIWGMYPYGHHHDPHYLKYWGFRNERRDNRNERRDNSNNRRQDLVRNAPGASSAGSVRSGGSYTRTNPKIEQVSGNRNQRTRDIVDNKVDNKTEITSESGTTNYRRVTGTTGSSAVYRDPASTTRARTEGTQSDNTFYRRSSNLSQGTRENTRSESTATTTNPGSSRSFYRGTQRPSTTVNPGSTGSSRSVRSSSGSTSGSRSTGSYNSGSSYRSSSSSSATRSSSMGSSVSSGASRSSSSGSTGGGGGASRSGSGGSYRR
ncbi:MAG: hypothetical protein KBC07_04470 [Bacteroidales bacterium]|jgi:hypothetical protein|nr:hypothetical protein [Bacteroidales bacterium]NLH23155.1 hypothetical protein [Bacteroidales bacterium]